MFGTPQFRSHGQYWCRLLAWVWFWSLAATSEATSLGEVLAKVNFTEQVARLDLPVHARLQDAAGNDYLIVLCPESRLSGCAYQVLDANPQRDAYIFARAKRPTAQGVGPLPVLLNDGVRLLLRATPEEAEGLAEKGFALRRLSASPLTGRWNGEALQGTTPQRKDLNGFASDSRVAEMTGRVQASDLLTLLHQLSGEEAVRVEGESYIIRTRHTRSGTPLEKATQFAYEQLQALGLAVSFHAWNLVGITNRNVIGTHWGTTRSNEVVLLTAHIDDMPNGDRAPGADDNASGTAAVLTAAQICRQYAFERTVRFILFTGEEQGMLGSEIYAAAAAKLGENIVAVVNLDMLAWNGSGPPTLRLHTRTPRTEGYTNDLYLASTFTNVVASYGLSNNLVPVITADADDASDHASFWTHGYSAINAKEDYPDDFNPYYHTVDDTVAHVAWEYFTAGTQAAVGTLAHLAGLAGDGSQGARVAGTGVANGQFWVRYQGVPGQSYTLQSASRVDGPWAVETPMPADASGTVEYQAPVAPGTNRFYRLVWP